MQLLTNTLFRRLAWLMGIAAITSTSLPAWSFSEDTDASTGEQHSTFHYEATLVLARAAGFSQVEAQEIAMANNVVDTFPDEFGTCEANPVSGAGQLLIIGTERKDAPTSPYFHWPRRGSANQSNGQDYPSGINTCNFFVGTSDPCPNAVPEIDGIEKWALLGDANALELPVCYSKDGSAFTAIPPGSLIALGVYLHSLADSYSHQICMEKAKTRNHDSSDLSECDALGWHISDEYGDGRNDPGIATSQQAGLAIWDALARYKTAQGFTSAPLYTTSQAQSFINKLVSIEAADDRSKYALKVYSSLK